MPPDPFAPGPLQRRRTPAYDTLPRVHSVTPPTGRVAGSTSITITGRNFVDGATVTVGGTAATSVVVVDSETITCDTPAGTAGVVDVVVTVGTQAGTGTSVFTYFDTVITKVTPTFGALAGGTTVQIEGYGFESGSSVTFDGVAATGFLFIDSQHIQCVTPARTTVGFVDIVVTGP